MSCNQCNGNDNERWYYGSGIGATEVVANGKMKALTVRAGSAGTWITIGNGEQIPVYPNESFGIGGTEFAGCRNVRITIEEMGEAPANPTVWFVAWSNG
jgi:hypothetical protein